MSTQRVMDTATQDVRAKALDNLLIGCAQIRPGQSVLVLNENDSNVVERPVVEQIARRAAELGGSVREMWSDHVERPDQIPAEVLTALAESDVTIFHHVIGGKLRFAGIPGKGIGVTNYASTASLLDSPWSLVPYGLWEQTIGLVSRDLAKARSWHITCPNGTDLKGTVPEREYSIPPSAEVFTLRSFPIGTHRPTSAAESNGTIALRWLVSSSNHFDGAIKLDQFVHAEIKNGAIVGFTGPRAVVDTAKRFFEDAGRQTNLEPYLLSSWHAGINPQAFTPWSDESDLNRWQSIGHNNPRTLHFHAVGAETPGELSLVIVDQTVTVDGEVFWDRGRFTLLERPAVQEAARTFADDGSAFRLNTAIGI